MALAGHHIPEVHYKTLRDKRVGSPSAARKAWERSPPPHLSLQIESPGPEPELQPPPPIHGLLFQPLWLPNAQSSSFFFLMLKLPCPTDRFIFSHMPTPPPALSSCIFTSHTFPALTQHHNPQTQVPLLSPKVGNIMAQPAFHPPSANQLS